MEPINTEEEMVRSFWRIVTLIVCIKEKFQKAWTWIIYVDLDAALTQTILSL